jgi:5-methylthioribose kinase
MRLDAENVARYLTDRGVVPGDADPEVEPLGGGVSNGVFRVTWAADAVVVKQPLANLAVEDDWPADVGRVHNEAAAARVYRDVVAEHRVDSVRVPEVRFEDHDEHVIAITAAPPSAETWKDRLLGGDVDAGVGEAVGEFLAASHEFASGDTALRDAFSNYRPFEQLRLDPYHRTVAKRHPDVAAAVDAEVERIRTARSTLVHGDYSPKNVLVDGTDGETRLWLLDFEVAHWGDPAFDVAFMCNHLFINSVYNSGRRDEYVTTAESFRDAYVANADVDGDFETNVVTELGVLMLARVDGKSPVEYVRSAATNDQLRALAKRILETDGITLTEFVDTLRSEVEPA